MADVDQSPPATGVDRRGFIFGSTAFVLAFHLPALAAQARRKGPPAPKAAPIADADGQRFNAFLTVSSDDIVTAIIAQTEGGQGNSTGMPQVIAAELGADWDKMRVQFSTERRQEFINTKLYKGLVLTAGSSSVTLFYEPMRKAAAATREMFVAAAVERWGVAPGECDVQNSKVIHRFSGRRFTFGELAEAAARQPVPQNPSLRKLSDMPLIGQRVQRLDAEAKSNGSARFGLDFKAPGMLWAAVRHGPVRGSTVASLDAEAARKAPGVRLVTKIPQGVAVVADHYWQAAQALQPLKTTVTFQLPWRPPPRCWRPSLPSRSSITAALSPSPARLQSWPMPARSGDRLNRPRSTPGSRLLPLASTRRRSSCTTNIRAATSGAVRASSMSPRPSCCPRRPGGR